MTDRFLSVATMLSLLSLTVACGDGFEGADGNAGSGANGQGAGAVTNSGVGAGGAGSGGDPSTGNGGNGASGGSGGSGGSVSDYCGAGDSGTDNLLLYTSLDSPTHVMTPTPGDGTDYSLVPTNPFVPAMRGNGIQLGGAGDLLSYRQLVNGTTNFNPQSGSVDFCYRPDYQVKDGQNHFILSWQAADVGQVTIRKADVNNNNEIHVNLKDMDSTFQLIVLSQDIPLQAGRWHRMTVSWLLQGTNTDAVRIYVDGSLLPMTSSLDNSISMPGPGNLARFWIGAFPPNTAPAAATFDELYVRSAPITP
jgi:hypothetical protein